VSAPEVRPGADASIRLDEVQVDLVELAALRERMQVLKALAARRGLSLPERGRLVTARDSLVLCVRPLRWLLLSAPAPAGVAAGRWQEACAGTAAVLDCSSALLALHLSGPGAREALARGCRLDLDTATFPPGTAAATIIAQVSVIIAALPSGFLLLTPATTGRHFREWLSAAAGPFGLASSTNVNVAALSGESTQ
jgi:heterotetrameric sarcosine oxidase gamma subunit